MPGRDQFRTSARIRLTTDRTDGILLLRHIRAHQVWHQPEAGHLGLVRGLGLGLDLVLVPELDPDPEAATRVIEVEVRRRPEFHGREAKVDLREF